MAAVIDQALHLPTSGRLLRHIPLRATLLRVLHRVIDGGSGPNSMPHPDLLRLCPSHAQELRCILLRDPNPDELS